MAAFCSCCGAEITLKAEACPVCGTPRHGMLKSDASVAADVPMETHAEAKQQVFCDKYVRAKKN